ncbi:MAG TPA: EAL domain-containing protein [Actinophytocola sp.]|nr:EAL domain-containing protein [Actinophytocola sp.]
MTGVQYVPPLMRFSEACSLVVAYLRKTIPLAFWSVTRIDGDRQIYVYVQDGAYGKVVGGSHAWSDSFCQYMITGSTPQIAPDAMAVPQYAAAGVAQVLPVGAYVGVPICDGDGSLYGTLCGLDPGIQPAELLDQAPLLYMLTDLLGQTLHADRMRAEANNREAEFALLLEDRADPVTMAERVVDAVQEPFTGNGTPSTFSASIGVVERPPAAEVSTIDMLLAHAGAAMGSAMHGGNGRFARYDPITSLTRTGELRLQEVLRRAIAAGSIEAVYQPIVELDSGRVIAFEALARWQHNGEMIDPDVFVPIAARSGLLPDLTDHMMGLAGAQLDRWSTALGHRQLQVSVNVPPTLISHRDFPARVAACIRHHGLAPEQLVLEVTEDEVLADPDAAGEVRRQLHEIGATLALDDFGSGYSSLLHLQQISPHSVKIDRGFARDLDTNPATERFMAALLALCRDLGLRVIVEGVERAAQADVLRRLGCSHAQGYLFGYPARPEEIDELAYRAG